MKEENLIETDAKNENPEKADETGIDKKDYETVIHSSMYGLRYIRAYTVRDIENLSNSCGEDYKKINKKINSLFKRLKNK